MARPGEMLGDERRLVALGKRREARKMGEVERFGRADRQADAVQRKRIERADRLEPPVRRPAGAHVVLGVDLEETEAWPALQDRGEMLRLEADADAAGAISAGLALNRNSSGSLWVVFAGQPRCVTGPRPLRARARRE